MRCIFGKLNADVYRASQCWCKAIFVRGSDVSDPWRSVEKNSVKMDI